MNCKICEQNRELRFGVCFECAEAECIISEGFDMFDRGLNGSDKPCKTAMDKVKLLREKGIIQKDTLGFK